jgi:hypothetical protein
VAGKNRIVIQNRFPQVKKGAREAVTAARQVWTEVCKEAAGSAVESKAGSRGYALQVGFGSELLGYQSARVFTTAHSSKWGDDPFFLRYFEYGTVHIGPMPFMRPGARKANKAWLTAMGTGFEAKIRMRTKI